MWFVAVLIFVFAVSLVPGLTQKFEKSIEEISGALTKGPTQTVVNAWVEVAFIGAGLGFAIWLAETHTAKKMGYEVAPPPVEPIHVAQPPTFGASGGYTAGPGGVVVHSGVSAGSGSGSPTVHVLDAPAPRSKSSRLGRRAERAALKADIQVSQSRARQAKRGFSRAA